MSHDIPNYDEQTLVLSMHARVLVSVRRNSLHLPAQVDWNHEGLSLKICNRVSQTSFAVSLFLIRLKTESGTELVMHCFIVASVVCCHHSMWSSYPQASRSASADRVSGEVVLSTGVWTGLETTLSMCMRSPRASRAQQS